MPPTKSCYLRNIPTEVHKKLKMAAAATEKSLQAFIVEAAVAEAERVLKAQRKP